MSELEGGGEGGGQESSFLGRWENLIVQKVAGRF